MKNDIAIVIPAYNPNEKLISLINQIVTQITNKVVVINDGSKSNVIFEKIKNRCVVLENKTNSGKGYSLKKGLLWIIKQKWDIIGIITADADGQHCINDIKNISIRLKNSDKKIILGIRDFSNKNIPIKNKLGNKIAIKIFKMKYGVEIKDTQTGLRGISIELLEQIIDLKGDRYEYEQNMLIYVLKNDIPYDTVDISTIYNKSKSYFNVIMDSYRIIKTLIKR